MAYLLMQHLERIMLDVAKADQTEDTKVRAEISLIEAHGKASERWRKTMKELNDYCATTGRPLNMGLADFMKPIILKVNKALQMENAPTADIGGPLSVGCSRFSVSSDEEKAGIRDPFPERSTNTPISQRPEDYETPQNPGEPARISGFSHEKWG